MLPVAAGARMIKFSRLEPYRAYMHASARRDWKAAMDALAQCVPLVEAEGTVEEVGYLYTELAEVALRGGNEDQALGYWKRAELKAKDSPLIRYLRIEFQAVKLSDTVTGAAECRRFREELDSMNLPEVAGAYGRPYYLAKLYALEGYCHVKLGEESEAGRCLDALCNLNPWHAPEYGVPLCAGLGKLPRFRQAAREFLYRYLEDRGRDIPEGGDRYDEEFREHIKEVLAGLA